MANTAFVKPGNLINFLGEVAWRYGGDPGSVRADAQLAKNLEKLVKGVKVDLMQRGELRKRSAKCVGVSKVSAEHLE